MLFAELAWTTDKKNSQRLSLAQMILNHLGQSDFQRERVRERAYRLVGGGIIRAHGNGK